MKKLLLLFIAILAISYSQEKLYSQSGWFWQNPLPQGNTLNAACFINSLTGYFCGNCATILKTTNGGNDLNVVSINTLQHLRGIYFFDTNTGFVVGYNSTILKTTNGGINWLIQFSRQSYTLNFITFISKDTGFACGRLCLYRTTNSGERWDSINTGTTYYDNCAINFIDNKTGFMISNRFGNPVNLYSVVLKTTNCGLNWEFSYSNGSVFNTIGFINNFFYVIGTDLNYSKSYILKTTNLGNNWNSLTINNKTFFGGYFLNQEKGYLTDGSVMKTTNGGITFEYLTNSNLYYYTKIFYADSSNIITGGRTYRIAKTSNSGVNWGYSFKSSFNGVTRSIHFPTFQIGYVAGDSGLIAKTNNAGLNWIKQNSSTTANLNSIMFYDSLFGIACGDSNVLVRTTNGGMNWIGENSFTFCSFKIVCIASSQTAYAAGIDNFLHRKLYKTTNRGNNWYQITSIPYNGIIECMKFLSADTGYVTGWSNYVLKTTNGGNNWIMQTLPDYGGETISFPENSYTGYIGGGSGRVFKTTNGGNTWFNVRSYQTDERFVNCIYFLNNNTGYLSNSGYGDFYNILLKTTNGGLNWYYLYACVESNFLAMQFLNTSVGYFVGPSGIVKTTNGGELFGIKHYENKINTFSLYQNYPNPFNPSTAIKFDIPKSSHVQIVVYDILGREVQQLLNEEKKPGSYEVTWDASGFASGVYFYKIITDELIETKKMVLMK